MCRRRKLGILSPGVRERARDAFVFVVWSSNNPRSNIEHTKRLNGVLSIARPRVLDPRSIFIRLATELTTLVGEPPIYANLIA